MKMKYRYTKRVLSTIVDLEMTSVMVNKFQGFQFDGHLDRPLKTKKMDDCGMTQAMEMIETLNQEHDAVLTENAKLRKEVEEYKELIKKIASEVCEPDCRWLHEEQTIGTRTKGCYIQNGRCRCSISQKTHKVKAILS